MSMITTVKEVVIKEETFEKQFEMVALFLKACCKDILKNSIKKVNAVSLSYEIKGVDLK